MGGENRIIIVTFREHVSIKKVLSIICSKLDKVDKTK
jgi:hypothetical protein